VAVLAELWRFEKSSKNMEKKLEKSGSGWGWRLAVGWGVAVAGWQWYQSKEEIGAVRMV
jgi:hypothetical protein